MPQPVAFVSGSNRIVVYQTERVGDGADYGLAATPGTQWVVSVLDITNFGTAAQTISLADFQYLVDDEGIPVVADLAQGPSAQLGFPDVQTDGSAAIPVDSTIRIAVAFPLPAEPATDPIPRIVFGDEQVNVASTAVPSLDVTVLSPVQPWAGLQGAVQTVPGNGTIEVDIAGTVEAVSLAGVVTPPVDGCFGLESSEAVSSLSGGSVWVEDDPTSDSSLVWYWDADREHLALLNQALVEQGFGAYDDASGTAYAAWLEAKSQTAEMTETGLWSTCEGARGEMTLGLPASTVAQTVSCADFDAWEWAQSVFESDPQQYDSLDPDGDGEACPELPRGGFAPAFWTDAIPDDVEEAEIVRLIDGDTLEVLIDGVSNRVRIYRADTPETQNEQHCGGAEAAAFADLALSYNDTPGVVYLERDENERDRFGRELAYVWFESGGDPYMLNHVLINNGWADDVDYGDHKYDQQLQDAAAFAKRHTLGVWELCGGFGIPLPDEPEPTAVPDVPDDPAPPEPEPPPSNDCDPNYTPCVPLVSYDLNCPDIGFAVTVIGGDPHGFDREGDGRGCESYG